MTVWQMPFCQTTVGQRIQCWNFVGAMTMNQASISQATFGLKVQGLELLAMFVGEP
jgi:hypothetical protein